MASLDLRLELASVTPQVWRVIRVPSDLRLDDLHHAIQAVMGWDDFHPHLFEVGAHEYGPRPDADTDDDADADVFREASAWAGEDHDVTVQQALSESAEGFTYVYDFDEDWRVRVTLHARLAAQSDAVVCVDGAHAGPQQEARDLDPFTLEAANRRLARARRPRATPEQPAGPGAGSEQQLLANLSLVVLMLGSRPTRHGTREAWKHIRVEILDSLHDAGLIDTDSQRRSVTITDAGLAHARRLLQRLRSL